MTQALLPGVDVSAFGDDLDFYETPAWVTGLILAKLPMTGRDRGRGKVSDYWHLVEPAAGRGAIIKAAVPYMDVWLVTAVELHAGRYAELVAACVGKPELGEVKTACTDFLAMTREQSRGDCELPVLCLLNPPYTEPRETIGLEFVEHCLEIAQPDGFVAALLPSGFASGKARYKRVHKHFRGSHYPIDERPDFGGDYGGGSRDFSWFTWDLASPRNEFEVLSRAA